MKVALVGARRNKNGIGHYIGNYFQRNGSPVVSLLGTSVETAALAANELKEFGINAQPYTNFDKMVAEQCPDAVVIASPSTTHLDYLYKALEAGTHIFCEKPFFVDAKQEAQSVLRDIFTLANKQRLTIAMNSQWPFALPYYDELCGTVDSNTIKRFDMRLSPLCSGKEMILDSVPHALSVLYCKCGPGAIKEIAIEPLKERMELYFEYQTKDTTCTVHIRLTQQVVPPRDFSFGFNDRIVHRSLDLESYEISINRAQKILKIADPLDLSVQDFMNAVRDKREPLIGNSHITHNTLLLNQIYESCTTL
jgi:hypothetical protein